MFSLDDNYDTIISSFSDDNDLDYNWDGSPNLNRKRHMKVLLDNIKNPEETSFLEKQYHCDYRKIARLVFPQLLTNEIIGVQPMTHPMAQIHVLHLRQTNFPNPASEYPRLEYELTSEIVESRTQHVKRCNISHVEGSYEDIAYEIASCVDHSVLSYLANIAGNIDTIFNTSSIGKYSCVGDMHVPLAVLIARKANLIAVHTRRGVGNWCVVSPTALTILMKEDAGFTQHKGRYNLVGFINKSIKVYVNPFADDETPVLVGYKGNDVDAGAFYCPYHLVGFAGLHIDSYSFEPCINFSTHYGFRSFEKDSFISGSQDYFEKIGININSVI